MLKVREGRGTEVSQGRHLNATETNAVQKSF